MKTTLLSLILLIISAHANAQVDLSCRLLTVSASPFEGTNKNLELAYIGASNVFAIEPGAVLGAELFTDERTSFQFALAGYNDKAGKPAGFASLFLKYKIAKKYKHSLTIGIGPSLFMRQSWATIKGYTDDELYIENAGNQYKLAWLSGEISYNYYLSKKADVYISLLRTAPKSFGIAAGAVFQLGGKKSRYGRRKGCDCPSYR